MRPLLLFVALVAAAIGLVLWLATRPTIPRSGVEVDPRIEPASEGGTSAPLDSLVPVERFGSTRNETARGNGTEVRASPSAPAVAHLEAMVVDASGSPIEGAELGIGRDTRALSDARGYVELELDPGRDPPRFGFAYEVHKDGYRPCGDTVRLAAGDRIRLGRVVLEARRDASVAGRLTSPWPRVPEGWVAWYPAAALPATVDAQAILELVQSGSGGSPDAEASPDGSFEVEDLPDEDGFLIASALGHHLAWTAVFRVATGERRVVDVDLVPDPDRSVLAGRVLKPDGTPMADAWVSRLEENGSSTATTSVDGTFALEGPTGSNVIDASDPSARFYPTKRITIEGTRLDLELVLGEPLWLEIEELDEDDRPIAWGHVQGREAQSEPPEEPGDSRHIDGFDLAALGREGRARVVLPQVPFQVIAMAPGYRTETFGPFDPQTLVGPLVLHLTPGQAVEGRVTHRGRPIADARVSVYWAREEEGWLRSTQVTSPDRPFVYQTRADVETDATTDGRGHFIATLHEDGSHAIAVQAEGFPVAFFGPHDWSMEAGARGLELELPRGGAIEGRVLVTPGASPAGRTVGASGPFGLAKTAVADGEGNYRIANLAPGSYQVRACKGPVNEFEALRGYSTLLQPSWDAVVAAESTAHFDVDLRDENSVLVRGRFILGTPGEGIVGLSPAGGSDRFSSNWIWEEPSGVSPDGSFELAQSTEGSFDFCCSNGFWNLFVPVQLHRGVNEIDVVLPQGAARMRRTSGPTSVPDPGRYRLVWEGASGWSAFSHIFIGEDQEKLRTAPAGPIRFDRIAAEGEDWSPFLEVDVREGEETLVELP